MLTLKPRQQTTLNQYQERQFLKSLCAHIRENYPAYAEVPPPVLGKIVALGLARAESYGLVWQANLAQFVYLMAAIAPNFDTHPAIHASLVNPAIAAENRIEHFHQTLPQGVWREAMEAASAAGWFWPGDVFALGRAGRIALSLVHALPAVHANSENAVAAALQAAEACGLTTEDRQFVFAACALHYGADFAARADWAASTLAPTLTPAAKTALLRLRLALDAGIWL